MRASLRARERSAALWFIVRHLGALARDVGARRLVQIGVAHVLDGRGPGQLLFWCRDRVAFLERGHPDLYQQWVDAVEPRLPAVTGDASLGAVTVVLGACRLQDVSETLKSIDRQTHPDCRILLSVPRSEFEHASEIAVLSQGKGNIEVKVLTGPQASDEEQLLLLALAAVETEHALTLRSGATLAPSAALELHREAVESGADLVYSDEDRVSDGVRRDPMFKPGASPDLQHARDYVGPVCLLRVGPGILGDDVVGSSLNQIVLDTLRADAVVRRVPRVLVHWHDERNLRRSPRQRGDLADPTNGRRELPDSEAAGVTASIIVPTRDRLDLLRRCIASIYAHSHHIEFEVVILDNRSRAPETLTWLANAAREWPGLKVIDADYEFNWSKLNNQGIEAARGKVCVFLNNDVETITEGWLETLVGNALRDEIGAVGTLLLYPDGTIQHAGVVLGMGGLADHVYRGCPASGREGFAFVGPLLPRNVLAVTGACLAVEQRKLSDLGGFDETFQICGDVDLCLRLHAAGYVNLYEPAAKAVYHESATRGRAALTPVERDRLLERFRNEVGGEDPFYNPNLNLRSRFPSFIEPFELD